MWGQRSVLSLLCLVVLTTSYDPGAEVTAEAVTLHIPSTTVTLPNGLRVVASSKPKLPMVSISVRVKVGSVDDLEDEAGLAAMTVRLLNKGTTHRTAVVIADELDFLGARLEANAGGTGSTISLSMLAKDVERGLDLFADLLRLSRFDADPIGAGAGTDAVGDSPAAGGSRRSSLAALPGNPVRRASLAETDLRLRSHRTPDHTRGGRGFHQRYYVPNNAIVVMVGALSEDAAGDPRALFRHMANATTGADDTATTGHIPGETGAHRGYERESELYPVGALVGPPGRSCVRCHPWDELHSRRWRVCVPFNGRDSGAARLAYAVDSEFIGGNQFPGFFYAQLQTAIPTTAQALQSLIAVIEGMQRIPVTPEELADMKRYYEGSLPGRAETYEQVTELLIDREFFGLPEGYWETEIQQHSEVDGSGYSTTRPALSGH